MIAVAKTIRIIRRPAVGLTTRVGIIPALSRPGRTSTMRTQCSPHPGHTVATCAGRVVGQDLDKDSRPQQYTLSPSRGNTGSRREAARDST